MYQSWSIVLPPTSDTSVMRTTPQMAYKRYRRYRRRYYRKSRYNRYNNGFNRRISAMTQMRDIARYAIKVTGTIGLIFNPGQTESVFFFSFYQVLQRNKQFQAMSILFDQFQIRGASITVRPRFDKAVGTAYENQLKYVSAVDRTGITNISSSDSGNGYTVNALTFNDICGYGSAKLNVMDSDSKNTIYHKIVATDLIERSQYLDTAVLRAMAPVQTSTNFTGSAVTLSNFVTFNPVFMMGVQIPIAPSSASQFPYDFTISYDLQFRGTRFDNETVTLNNNDYQ